jgi:hypothetical protein
VTKPAYCPECDCWAVEEEEKEDEDDGVTTELCPGCGDALERCYVNKPAYCPACDCFADGAGTG